MGLFTYSRIGGDSGSGAAYAVTIEKRLVARIERAGQRWLLRYGCETLTLASLPAAVGLVERYADKIAAGEPIGSSGFEINVR